MGAVISLALETAVCAHGSARAANAVSWLASVRQYSNPDVGLVVITHGDYEAHAKVLQALPENQPRPVSQVFASPEQTALGQALLPASRAHPGDSAFVVLDTPLCQANGIHLR